MSTVVLDTITGKSTATTITIGSTPVVSASANSMTIRGEGSNQTSIQQGLAKMWLIADMGDNAIDDSFNAASLTDHATGKPSFSITNDFNSVNHSDVGLVGNTAAHIFYNGGNAVKTASSTGNFSIYNTGDAAVDISPYINITCHGDLA